MCRFYDDTFFSDDWLRWLPRNLSSSRQSSSVHTAEISAKIFYLTVQISVNVSILTICEFPSKKKDAK
jgi:hypothetical protein